MVVDTMTTRTLSWEDLVLRNKSDGQKVVDESNPLDKDFALQDEDVKKSIANDIPSIDFSKSIHQLLVEEMATSVNGYFLDKYQSVEDYEKILSQVFRVFYTERKYYEKLGDLIGKVTKLYFNTDNKARGHYARMVVYINLDKPLISQVLFNEKIQKIKYDSLLVLVATILAVVESSIENGEYNPWMLVEWKSKCQSHEPNKFERSEKGEEITGSRFQSLVAPDSKVVNKNFVKEDLSRSKKHGKRVLIYDGGNSRNGVRGSGTGARKDIMGQSFGLISRTQQERHHAIRPSKGQKSAHIGFKKEEFPNDPLTIAKKIHLNSTLAANVGMVAGIFSSILVEGNNDFSLSFNLTFEELNEEAVVVKGGILDAKKHSTIVFQEKENPKLIETSDSSELYIVGVLQGNRFKALGNTRVTFFGSMLKATDLISSQLNGQEAKIMMN
ncbi:hypothetical protein Golax_014516 [Gossypium laxum]|uniref:Uncharacterized protein n=1 Tax=Gossypium laxum TaxID=34288 RepID=A0A7J8ZUY7_9ROSI|nr:hypothetical protein [Gossypium laxum]